MADSCILYYITDRKALAGDEHTRRNRLLDKISEAASAGIDYIQLREKDLCIRDLEALANEAIAAIRQSSKQPDDRWRPATALLINSRADVAIATEAAGVHLPTTNDLSPAEVRTAWQRKCGAGAPARELSPRDPLISISCHSPQEVAEAAANGVNLALFAPVFGKKDAPGAAPTGLDTLREACRANIRVLALGGVTLENAEACLRAGAAGIAAIRLFQENNIAEVVRVLRGQ